MLILGLDFETTGVNPREDLVVEAGLALWDSTASRAVRQADFLVRHEEFDLAKWGDAEKHHGISPDLPQLYGFDEKHALDEINAWADRADAVVAFNGTEFDKELLRWWNGRHGIVKDHLWIDTRLDLPEPMVGKLTLLAAERGFLNPFPHQALSDVLTMLRILDDYDLGQVVARARIPNIHVRACVSFQCKEQAKERGYWWVPERKLWVKKIKQCDLERERLEAPFVVEEARL